MLQLRPCEFHHHESTGVGFNWGLGARSLLITTGMPLRNLKNAGAHNQFIRF